MARSNCLRSVVYCAVRRSALSATPATSAQVATVVRLSVNARISVPCSGVPRRASSPTRTPSSRSSKSGSWFMICWRSSVRPVAFAGNEEDRDTVVDARGHEDQLGRGRAGNAALGAVETPAVAVARRGGHRALGLAAVLDERGRQQHLAGNDLRQDGLLRLGAVAGDRQAPRSRAWGSSAAARPCGRPRATPCTGRGSRGRGRRRSPAARCRAGSPSRTRARCRGRTSRRSGRAPSGAAGPSGLRGCAPRDPPAPAALHSVRSPCVCYSGFSGGYRACSARRSRSGRAASRWCRPRT